MSSHDPGPLLDRPERTRDSLETRFRRAYGREMTQEERKYFGLVESITRFEPDGKADLQENPQTQSEVVPETTKVENPEPHKPDRPKAA